MIAIVPVPEIAAYHDGRYVPGRTWCSRPPGNVEHERLVELVEQGLRRLTPGQLNAAAAAQRRTATPTVRFHQKQTEQYHLCLGAPGLSRAATSGASRCACSTRSSAARAPRACSRRCARSAGWPTRSTRTRASTWTPVRWRSTSARAPTRGRGDGGDRRRAAQASGRRRVSEDELERAKENVKGRTVLSMESTLGAHEPARLVGPDGSPAAVARRDRSRRSTRSASTT